MKEPEEYNEFLAFMNSLNILDPMELAVRVGKCWKYMALQRKFDIAIIPFTKAQMDYLSGKTNEYPRDEENTGRAGAARA